MTLTLKICSAVYLSYRIIQKSHWVHLSTTYGLRATKKKPENALRASRNDLDLEVLLTKRCVLLSSFKLSPVLLLYHQRFGSYWGKTVKMTFYALGRWVNDLLWKNVCHHQKRLVEYFHFHPGFMLLSPIGWELSMKNHKNDLLCPQAMGQWPFTEKFLPPPDAPRRALLFSPQFCTFISHRLGDIQEKPQISAKIPDPAHFGPP